VEPYSQFRCHAEEKNLFTLSGIGPWFLICPASTLVTILPRHYNYKVTRWYNFALQNRNTCRS
jgi:hypothetical protein